MPKGVYERKPKEVTMTEATAPSAPAKMFPVLLLKNYVPIGPYEIVGHLRAEVKRKDAAGRWSVVAPEEFIEGEMKPHNSPGVGFPGKIWAGTTIRLPAEEAKTAIAKKIAERADAIAA